MLNIFTQKKNKKDEQLPFMYFYNIQNKKPDEFIKKIPVKTPSPIVPSLLTSETSSYVSPSDSSPYNPSYIPPLDETIPPSAIIPPSATIPPSDETTSLIPSAPPTLSGPFSSI